LDLTRDVIYRTFYLNDPGVVEDLTAGQPIQGCVLDGFDLSDVDAHQFSEKRSQMDGMDAGDVWLGSRRIRLSGTLYGATRANLYDRLWALRAIMSPVLAQREEPQDKGYRPLYFTTPTDDSDYGSGLIELMVMAMPRAFSASIMRDTLGGEDADALAIPWQATMVCKDPSIMSADPVDTTTDGAGPVTGTVNNRGTYICPVNALWLVGTAGGTIAATIGDGTFIITLAASSNDRILRFKGEDKVFTLEEVSTADPDVTIVAEVPRRDLIIFNSTTEWPSIDSGPGQPYSFTYTGLTVKSGSHWWFYERYA
jgi:hypothetical protein